MNIGTVVTVRFFGPPCPQSRNTPGTVAAFYQDFVDVAGIDGVSKDAVNEAAQRNQNILQRAAAIAAEIFAPLIPAIITGGLILGFRNCIDQLYLFENGTKTLVELSQFWAGMDQFLWLIGESVFHMGIPWGFAGRWCERWAAPPSSASFSD